METDLKPRKQVSLDQLKALVDFLKERPELAKGLVRGRRAKLHTLKHWKLCAKTLNLIKDGAVKDGKGWSKYWCDWKYRVRRRSLELKLAEESNRPPPEGVTPLSPLEEDILDMIGENSDEGIVVKVDPLADEESDKEQEKNETLVNEEEIAHKMSTSGRKRKHSFTEVMEDEEKNSSPERKPKMRNKDASADVDKEASEFLRLEQEKVNEYQKLNENLQGIAASMRQMTNVMNHIKDILAKLNKV